MTSRLHRQLGQNNTPTARRHRPACPAPRKAHLKYCLAVIVCGNSPLLTKRPCQSTTTSRQTLGYGDVIRKRQEPKTKLANRPIHHPPYWDQCQLQSSYLLVCMNGKTRKLHDRLLIRPIDGHYPLAFPSKTNTTPPSPRTATEVPNPHKTIQNLRCARAERQKHKSVTDLSSCAAGQLRGK